MPTATGARTSTPSKKTGPGRRRARSVPGNPAAGSMSARRRKAREKAAAPAWELWCHSRRTVPAGEEQSARPTDVSGQTAPRSVRPERKRAERVSQTTHSERSPKTRRIDAGPTVSFDVRTKKRLTAEPPPHAALTSRPTTVRETTEIRSGTSDTDGARTGEYDRAAEFRPKKGRPHNRATSLPVRIRFRHRKIFRHRVRSSYRQKPFPGAADPAACRIFPATEEVSSQRDVPVGPASFRPSGSSETPSAVRPPDVPARRFRTNRRF